MSNSLNSLIETSDKHLYELVVDAHLATREDRAVAKQQALLEENNTSDAPNATLPARLVKGIAARLVQTFDGVIFSNSIPPALLRSISESQNTSWQVKASPTGDKVAIVEGEEVHIRGRVEDGQLFSRHLSSIYIGKDPFASWRRLSWSNDGNLVAVSGSDGLIQILNVQGQRLVSILPITTPRNATGEQPRWESRFYLDASTLDPSGGETGKVGVIEPVAFLQFIDTRTRNDFVHQGKSYTHELIVITYDGILRSYLINQYHFVQEDESSRTTFGVVNSQKTIYRDGVDAGGSVTFFHRFNLRPWHECIATGVMDHDKGLLYLAGRISSRLRQKFSSLSREPISSWRVLDQTPWYDKMGGDAADQDEILQQQDLDDVPQVGITSWMGAWKQKRDTPKKFLLSMDLSPDGQHAVTVDGDGRVCVWISVLGKVAREYDARDLRYYLSGEAPVEEERGRRSGVEEIELQRTRSPSRARIHHSFEDTRSIVHVGPFDSQDDVNLIDGSTKVFSAQWFTNTQIVLQFTSGHVAVYDLELQGDTMSWCIHFPTPPQLTLIPGKRFFLVDAIPTLPLAPSERPVVTTTSPGLWQKLLSPFRLLTNLLLWHWESDTTQVNLPRRVIDDNDVDLILFGLFETDPVAALRRRIDIGQYEQALRMCQTYNFDPDVVLKAHWFDGRAEVSQELIEQVLDRIDDEDWVLEAIYKKTPASPKAARLLYEYGLARTELPEGQSAVEVLQELETLGTPRLEQLSKTLIKCRYRLEFLRNLDRLSTYEAINREDESPATGQAQAVPDLTISPTEIVKEVDIVPSDFAIQWARFKDVLLPLHACHHAILTNMDALRILFSHHGDEVLPYRMSILERIPETVDPITFKDLVPKIEHQSEIPWPQQRWRSSLDWVEDARIKDIVQSSDPFKDPITDAQNLSSLTLRPYPAPTSMVADWYASRARTMEKESGLVDHALQMIVLAQEGGLEKDQGLITLHKQLSSLARLVYEVLPVESKEVVTLSLTDFQDMDMADVVKVMMAKTDADRVVDDLQQIVIPYLRTRPDASVEQLLSEWILEMAKARRLDVACTVVEALGKTDVEGNPSTLRQQVNITDQQLNDIIFDACYACPQVSANDILLMNRMYDLPSMANPENESRAQQLDDHLNAAEILDKMYRVSLPLTWFEVNKDKAPEQAQLLRRMVNHVVKKTQSVGESESYGLWKQLRSHVDQLREWGVFTELDQNLVNTTIAREALRSENIRFAKDFLFPKSTPPPLAPEEAEKLVLDAAREFFDNADIASKSEGGLRAAHECLKLLPPSEVVQKELDLIDATDELQKSKVSMVSGTDLHPIQVRLCEDKLQLVNQALRADRTGYTRPEKYLKLARKLGYEDDPEANAQLYAMMVDAALDNHDFKRAYDLCQTLSKTAMNSSGKSLETVFKACERFARDERVSNLDARLKMIALAQTICPPNQLGYLVLLQRSLESRSRLKDLSEAIPQDAPDLSKWSLRAHSPRRPSLSVLSPSSFSDNELGQVIEELDNARETLPTSSERNKIHEFYQSVDNHLNLDTPTYGYTHEDVDGASLAETALRLSRVSVNDLNVELDDDRLLIASQQSPSDALLRLAHLLEISNEDLPKRFFRQVDANALNEQLACYYFALRSMILLATSQTDHVTDLDVVPPQAMLSCLNHLVSDPNWQRVLADSPTLSRAFENVREYAKVMRDKRQEQIQQDIWAKRSIDGNLFQSDPDYRRQQILGLMQTVEERGLEDAMLLASSNGISKEDMYLTHLKWLFASNAPHDVLAKRLNTMKELVEKYPDEVMEVLQQVPQDDLSHDQRLVLYKMYLECLENTDSPNPKVATQLQTRYQILQMLKNSSLGDEVSFVKLMDANYENNVSSLANVFDPLLHNNSDAQKAMGIASLVLNLCHLKEFEGQDDTVQGNLEKLSYMAFRHLGYSWESVDIKDPGHFVDHCVSFYRHMNSQDIGVFLKKIRSGGKRLRLEDEAKLAQDSKDALPGLEVHLNNLVALEKVKDPVTKQGIDVKPWLRYMDDSFGGDFDDPIGNLCENMILAGKSPYILHQVTRQFSQHPRPNHAADKGLDEKEIYSRLLEIIMGAQGQEALESLGLNEKHSPLTRAEKLIESVVAYPSQEPWMEELKAKVLKTAKQLSADSRLPPEHRRALILILNEHFTLQSEEASELRDLKVQSIVKESWDRWVDMEELTLDQRSTLFDNLLSTVEDESDRLDALISILEEWSLETPLSKDVVTCWSKLFGWMARQNQFEKLFQLRLRKVGSATLDAESEQSLLNLLDSMSREEAIKHRLLSPDAETRRAGINDIKPTDRTLHLLALGHLDLDLIDNPNWPSIKNTLLNPEDGNANLHRVLLNKWVVKLKDAGYMGIAASLGFQYLNHRGASRLLSREGIRSLFTVADYVSSRLSDINVDEGNASVESSILRAFK